MSSRNVDHLNPVSTAYRLAAVSHSMENAIEWKRHRSRRHGPPERRRRTRTDAHGTERPCPVRRCKFHGRRRRPVDEIVRHPQHQPAGDLSLPAAIRPRGHRAGVGPRPSHWLPELRSIDVNGPMLCRGFSVSAGSAPTDREEHAQAAVSSAGDRDAARWSMFGDSLSR